MFFEIFPKQRTSRFLYNIFPYLAFSRQQNSLLMFVSPVEKCELWARFVKLSFVIGWRVSITLSCPLPLCRRHATSSHVIIDVECVCVSVCYNMLVSQAIMHIINHLPNNVIELCPERNVHVLRIKESIHRQIDHILLLEFQDFFPIEHWQAIEHEASFETNIIP